MKNIILFDLDGTLIDSTDAILSTFQHSFKEMNYDFKGSNEDIKSLIGYPLDVMYLKLGIKEKFVWDFVDTYKKRYKLISKQQTELLETAKESLQYASTFARLSVVTTKTGSYSKELLEHMEVMHYFEHLIGREDVQNPKPHPEPINKTLELMNVEKNSNIWMIGDTELDLIAANSAGIKSVGVLCGYGDISTLKKHTPYIVKNSLEAVKLIEENSRL
ncbi:HAD family hydrolase [Arcobacter arenosus]|uniref:phosphoglycolate phosphatase n=1 Tax=Arcobacter arenosus TaxID=2576037 RepID=A0A5R8Y2J2_9BACT|nr:HAD family hydrolase [Arcobacter arenosus]TLP39483.1 HAD family hydrolase [Arcobacter arenosus]